MKLVLHNIFHQIQKQKNFMQINICIYSTVWYIHPLHLICYCLVMMVEVIKYLMPRKFMVNPISSASAYEQKKVNWFQLNRYFW